MKANDVKDHDQTENIDALGVASENGTDEVEGSGEEGFNDSDIIEKENDKRQTEAHGENDGLNSKDGQLGMTSIYNRDCYTIVTAGHKTQPHTL